MSTLTSLAISELVPTDTELNGTSFVYYHSGYPLLQENNPPEIVEIEGIKYIADGHNQIFDLFRRGKTHITAKYTTMNNARIGMEVLIDIFDIILKKAETARKMGIFKITDYLKQ